MALECLEDDVGTSEDASIILKARGIVTIPRPEDQMPYRKDKRKCLKKSRPWICSINQMEGLAPVHDNWMLLGGPGH